jgi:hypothetical protein
MKPNNYLKRVGAKINEKGWVDPKTGHILVVNRSLLAKAKEDETLKKYILDAEIEETTPVTEVEETISEEEAKVKAEVVAEITESEDKENKKETSKAKKILENLFKGSK